MVCPLGWFVDSPDGLLLDIGLSNLLGRTGMLARLLGASLLKTEDGLQVGRDDSLGLGLFVDV